MYSPLAAALRSHQYERLSVRRAEPVCEAVQGSLHVGGLDDGEGVCVSQLVHAQTLGTLQGEGTQAA